MRWNSMNVMKFTACEMFLRSDKPVHQSKCLPQSHCIFVYLLLYFSIFLVRSTPPLSAANRPIDWWTNCSGFHWWAGFFHVTVWFLTRYHRYQRYHLQQLVIDGWHGRFCLRLTIHGVLCRDNAAMSVSVGPEFSCIEGDADAIILCVISALCLPTTSNLTVEPVGVVRRCFMTWQTSRRVTN